MAEPARTASSELSEVDQHIVQQVVEGFAQGKPVAEISAQFSAETRNIHEARDGDRFKAISKMLSKQLTPQQYSDFLLQRVLHAAPSDRAAQSLMHFELFHLSKGAGFETKSAFRLLIPQLAQRLTREQFFKFSEAMIDLEYQSLTGDKKSFFRENSFPRSVLEKYQALAYSDRKPENYLRQFPEKISIKKKDATGTPGDRAVDVKLRDINANDFWSLPASSMVPWVVTQNKILKALYSSLEPQVRVIPPDIARLFTGRIMEYLEARIVEKMADENPSPKQSDAELAAIRQSKLELAMGEYYIFQIIGPIYVAASNSGSPDAPLLARCATLLDVLKTLKPKIDDPAQQQVRNEFLRDIGRRIIAAGKQARLEMATEQGAAAATAAAPSPAAALSARHDKPTEHVSSTAAAIGALRTHGELAIIKEITRIVERLVKEENPVKKLIECRHLEKMLAKAESSSSEVLKGYAHGVREGALKDARAFLSTCPNRVVLKEVESFLDAHNRGEATEATKEQLFARLSRVEEIAAVNAELGVKRELQSGNSPQALGTSGPSMDTPQMPESPQHYEDSRTAARAHARHVSDTYFSAKPTEDGNVSTEARQAATQLKIKFNEMVKPIISALANVDDAHNQQNPAAEYVACRQLEFALKELKNGSLGDSQAVLDFCAKVDERVQAKLDDLGPKMPEPLKNLCDRIAGGGDVGPSERAPAVGENELLGIRLNEFVKAAEAARPEPTGMSASPQL